MRCLVVWLSGCIWSFPVTVAIVVCRCRDDNAANTRPVHVFRDGKFVVLPSQDVVVGDVVKVWRGEEFPADLVFLSAAHIDPTQRSVCHVQVQY